MTVHEVGAANHLQVLYAPFYREVAAGINQFVEHARLAPTPTAEEKRVDFDEYPKKDIGKMKLAVGVLLIAIGAAFVLRRCRR